MPQAFSLLQRAILEALAYSDIFDYPLRANELHRYLPMAVPIGEVCLCADEFSQIESHDGYYHLPGRREIVAIRKQREADSRIPFEKALYYGRLLGRLPFVRMVALTGSLAMMNLSKNPDMDFMLVTAHARVWTTRAFAILLGKFSRPFGHTLCPNLIISEKVLEWPLHDLYSARELCQMVPITGMEVYDRLREANRWSEVFLPNAKGKPLELTASSASQVFETLLHGKAGGAFEKWEMTRKIRKFSQQEGFGEETVFTADVCQGNFHHHRKWTRIAFEEKLASLHLEFPVKYMEGGSVSS